MLTVKEKGWAHDGCLLRFAEMGIRIRRKLGTTTGLKVSFFDADLLVGGGVVAVVAVVVYGRLLHDGLSVAILTTWSQTGRGTAMVGILQIRRRRRDDGLHSSRKPRLLLLLGSLVMNGSSVL